MKKNKNKISRLAVSLLALVMLVFAFDSGWRITHQLDNEDYIVEEGKFVSRGGIPDSLTLVSDTNPEATSPVAVADPGCTSKAVTKDDIFKGRLVPYRGDMPVIADMSESRVNLAEYKNDCYSTLGVDFPLTKDAADGLNAMMLDYSNATGLTDFAIYGTENTLTGYGSPCPVPFSENKTGNTVDLAIVGIDGIIQYDGGDAEAWVIQNCTNYGYVLRYPQNKNAVTGEGYYPWHLRFVGQPHALVMGANNMCLEEYVKFLQKFTKDAPFECNVGERTYEIYSVPSMGDATYLSVPLSGNYEVSGDGSAGYIITIEK